MIADCLPHQVRLAQEARARRTEERSALCERAARNRGRGKWEWTRAPVVQFQPWRRAGAACHRGGCAAVTLAAAEMGIDSAAERATDFGLCGARRN